MNTICHPDRFGAASLSVVLKSCPTVFVRVVETSYFRSAFIKFLLSRRAPARAEPTVSFSQAGKE